MIKFLLQTVNGKVRHDFVFEMEHAIDYQNWRGNEMKAYYCELEDIPSLTDEVEELIPIGTVEFVHSFIDHHVKANGSQKIHPLNVPNKLISMGGRLICNYILPCNENIANETDRLYAMEDYQSRLPNPSTKDCEVYIKSNDKIKSPVNGWYKLEDILNIDKIPDGRYQISTPIEVASEYRCFIYRDELKGVQYYSGDFTVFPSISWINEMMNTYYWGYESGDAPQAYTLDVAVTRFGKTVIMECHEFYSCGLYGFNDYSVLPYMFVRTFNDIKKRILNE